MIEEFHSSDENKSLNQIYSQSGIICVVDFFSNE